MPDCGCPPHFTTVAAAFLTPVVAAVVAYLAYRQWQTARNKLKLDLFEKRFAVYLAIRNTISQIGTTGRTNSTIELEFLQGVQPAKWLFSNRVSELIEKELWSMLVELGTFQTMAESRDPTERTKYIHAQAETKKKLFAVMQKVDEIFSPYLSLEH